MPWVLSPVGKSGSAQAILKSIRAHTERQGVGEVDELTTSQPFSVGVQNGRKNAKGELIQLG
jgi:hypothetical protein